MFCKNLRFYRLKNAMTKKELAEKSELTPMAITHYENGTRTPNMEVLKRLADALGVRVSDFLEVRNENLVFAHGEFRKTSTLPVAKRSMSENLWRSISAGFIPLWSCWAGKSFQMRRSAMRFP